MYYFLLLLLVGCGMEFSPWDAKAPNNDLTAKHLGMLGGGISGKPFTVAIMGDPQAVPEAFNNTVSVVNQRKDVDFSLIAGDITDRGMRREYVFVDNVIKRALKPVLTVVGNHDGLNNGDALYKQMFGPLDYSFVYNGITFVMWNNNAYEWSVNLGWLEQTILNAPSKVVVVSHQAPYSLAMTPTEEATWKRIRKSPKMIASIHGHSHAYNFFKEDGLPVYTVDRVEQSHFGLVKFDGNKVSFSNCDVLCEEISK